MAVSPLGSGAVDVTAAQQGAEFSALLAIKSGGAVDDPSDLFAPLLGRHAGSRRRRRRS